MKSINDIILTNAISAYLDESIIKRIENLKDYHINECCCDCDCKCCEPCCCGKYTDKVKDYCIKIYNKYIKKTN